MTKFVDFEIKKHLIYLLDSLNQLSTVDDESMFLRCMKMTAISYSQIQEILGVKEVKILWARVDEWPQRIHIFPYTPRLMHTWSQWRLWQHAQNLYKFKAGKTPAWGRTEHNAPPLAKSVFTADVCYGEKNVFFISVTLNESDTIQDMSHTQE